MFKDSIYRGFTKKHLHEILREMLLIRITEEKIGFDYRLRKIGGFCHLCVGQEAIPTGTITVLDLEKDYVLTSYRDHGHAILCNIDVKAIFAELYGKITGCSHGKGGSMHMFNAAKGFLGGNGIVGAQIPIATGTAFAQKYKKNKGVTLCFFGDGALVQGGFHESVNLAQLWSLPCIYIIENNHYGMGTAVDRAVSIQDFSKVGAPYGVQGEKVDGMNFFSVYEAFSRIVKNVRKTSHPYIVEISTYRYYGHSMSDPGTYRTKEEVNEFKKQDPIVQMKGELIKHKLLTKEEYQALQKSVEKQVVDAQTFGKESPEPSIETMYQDILA